MVAVELNPDAKQSELVAAVEPVVDRLHRTYKAAQEALTVATAEARQGRRPRPRRTS